MWKDINPATQQNRSPYIFPKYRESEWWLASEIQKEVRKKTGLFISLQKIGKIAKEHNLIKKTTYGFKLYHRSVVDLAVKHLKEYNG